MRFRGIFFTAGIVTIALSSVYSPAYADNKVEDKGVTADASHDDHGHDGESTNAHEVDSSNPDIENKHENSELGVLAEYGINEEDLKKAEALQKSTNTDYAHAKDDYDKSVDSLSEIESQLSNIRGEKKSLDDRLKVARDQAELAKENLARSAASLYRNGVSDETVTQIRIITQPIETIEDLNNSSVMGYVLRGQERESNKSLNGAESVQQLSDQKEAVVKSINTLHDNAAKFVRENKEKLAKAEKLRDESKKSLEALQKKQADAKKRLDEAMKLRKEQAVDLQKLQGDLLKKAGKNIDLEVATKDGVFPLPLPSDATRVTSNYGFRPTPAGTIDYGGRGGYIHAGIDFGAACGTPVYAVADGVVWMAGPSGTAGNAVGINHGLVGNVAFATRYHHFSKVSVSVGDKVRKGEVIGYSGTTGNSTGCHLHFETLVNGKAVDPKSFLTDKPVKWSDINKVSDNKKKENARKEDADKGTSSKVKESKKGGSKR